MRPKNQDITKTKGALGLYIDELTIAVCIVRDPAAGSSKDKAAGSVQNEKVRLLTHIERTAVSGGERLVQQVKALCAPEIGDTNLALDCWIASGRAQCLTVPVTAPANSQALLHFDVAHELGAYVAKHTTRRMDQGASPDEVKSVSASNWLDNARPKEPPVFDYLLRSGQLKTTVVEAWLWWAGGESDLAFNEAMVQAGTPVKGLVPDGIALYRGLQHYWQEKGVALDPLQGKWVLVDVSTQTSAWFFCDCWFRVHKQYDTADIFRDREITQGHTVVIWGCSSKHEDFPFAAEAAFNHLLEPYATNAQASRASKPLPCLIALGLALQGAQPRVSEWYSSGDCPNINLLPWRGQRLQQLRYRFLTHTAIVTSLLAALALLWAGVLNGLLAGHLERQSIVAAQLERREQGARQAEQQHKNWRQEERARNNLVGLADTGVRQLDNLQRVLEQIPACVSVSKIVLNGTSISVSGSSSDPAALRLLPEKLFAAFAEDGKNILNAWPVLLADEPAQVHFGRGNQGDRFVLQVSFDKTLKARVGEAAQNQNKEDPNKEDPKKENPNEGHLHHPLLSKENLGKAVSNGC